MWTTICALAGVLGFIGVLAAVAIRIDHLEQAEWRARVARTHHTIDQRSHQ